MEYTPSFRDQLYHSVSPNWRDNLDDELYHHGIKGMHWGVRRFQNPDGSLTPAGKKRQKKLLKGVESAKRTAKNYRNAANEYEKNAKEHPMLGFSSQILADKSRAMARQADRDAKHLSAKATFDKNKIRKANKEWLIDVAKDSAVGPTTRETYRRNRAAGKSRVNSALRGLAADAVSTHIYPDAGYKNQHKNKKK